MTAKLFLVEAEDDGSEQRDFGVAPVCPDHDASKDAP